ncbi:NADH-quinone oxidoreductase subunit J [Streptomyces sp. XM4193]|nr:NADH-quinone oxidoreductase subunit J [Streptomyces sp. XM4193]MCK1795397.1 NADH-quinone oxidoreductase subunit J [Streptomyces sp. XM4193]
MSPTGVEIAFVLVGLVTLGAAIMAVTSKQLVHAALWLVLALGGIAVEYLLLTAEFIAWVQVLIYVGSVVVLLLFGLMLTRAPIGPSPDADSGNRWVALAVALATAATLVTVVVDAFVSANSAWITLDTPQGDTATIGESLFRYWVLPFEALSVLLLAALVGAIVLSRRRSAAADAAPRTPARTPARTSRPAAPTVSATPPASATPPVPGVRDEAETRPAASGGPVGQPPGAGERADADGQSEQDPGTESEPRSGRGKKEER